ncbi:cell fate regulator YaaT (PSP1 superfamily)/ribosomal protein L12E/L44/L45/RPP1/RPP2 [Pontibacter aydingkolensis]|uniref:Signal peptidase-like protein n=1 Tax=Pontibacter aydingkolensis TaxID=1911536 RepID=A0ABS7CP41_9BACT|nr:regulatory iron-sulfur-containing complex subunit RicT [Pontibacter aydingkolensis]MBW7465606.1 Signal peptidase-like protein [Pontibacter aydingkolensis]
MELPVSFEEFDIVEIRFKGGRKDFYRNNNRLELTTGDAVVVDVPNGHHIGFVSLKGELVRLQMMKKKVDNNEEIRSIYRIANEKDMEKFNEVRDLEGTTMYRSREIIQQLGLKMKLSDVEYQADKSKATFYYSADDRVDFRDLIRKLAEEFKVRIEMRQISLRHEAGRLGGIGSCGRELCCSTWLTDFKSVSTTAARYQNLSLNPSKLSGQCGRLKCCLNYELETYMNALKDIPTVNRPLQTQQGDAILQKTDIFKRMMWFGYKGDNNWYAVPVERVQEIQELNAKGVAVEALVLVKEEEQPKQNEFVAQVEGSLERLDDKFKSKKKKKKKKKKPGAPADQAATEDPKQQKERPERKQEQPERGEKSEQDQRPRKQKPFKNKNKDRENRPPREGKASGEVREQREPREPRGEQREGREQRERRGNRPPRTPRPDGQPGAAAPAAGQERSPDQKPKKRRKPFKGKKPDQESKPPRTDA